MEEQINSNDDEFKELIKQAKEKVNEVLKFFNWKAEDILKFKHDAAKKEEEQEEETEEEELPFPESLSTENSVKLDENALSSLLKKENVEVPQKFSDLQTKFTREEKLRIYEYVVEQTPSRSKENSLLTEQEKQFAEMVYTIKREKKKRRKYRTMKPTYMEELRAVVDMQMQALERCHEEQNRKRRRENRRKRSPSPKRKRR